MLVQVAVGGVVRRRVCVALKVFIFVMSYGVLFARVALCLVAVSPGCATCRGSRLDCLVLFLFADRLV
jgi:hypothetical protein